jgi:hypothetical protein
MKKVIQTKILNMENRKSGNKHPKNLKISVSKKTIKQVIVGLKSVVLSADREPIIGHKQNAPNKIYLIYQAVKNASAIANKARELGASSAEKF